MDERLRFRLAIVRNAMWLLALAVVAAGVILMTIYLSNADVPSKNAEFYSGNLLLLGTPILVVAAIFILGGALVSAAMVLQEAREQESDALLQAVEDVHETPAVPDADPSTQPR